MEDKFMDIALEEAKKALQKENVPVGAVIIKNNKIIAKAHNLKKSSKNVMDHAEIICIKKANKKIKDWRLNGCDMYVTLEPCEMCKEVINSSRITNVYYSSKRRNKVNYQQTRYILVSNKNNYQEILKNFFKKIR